MNHTTLIFTIFSVLVGILLSAIWSSALVYAQQRLSSSPTVSSSLITTTISAELKAKMCDPSNPSLKVVNTTEARVCGIPKTVKPPSLSATPPTSAASSSPQQTTTTKPTAVASVAAAPKKQQQIATTINNGAVSRSTGDVTAATISPVSNPSLKPSSAIAPQVSALNQQQQQLQPQLLLTTSNYTAVQNYILTSTSPVLASGKLMYIGYHGGNADDSVSTGKKSTTKSDTDHSNRDSGSKDKRNSDTKSPSHHSSSTAHHSSTAKSSSDTKSPSHDKDGSKSSSKKSSQSNNHKDHDSNGSNNGKKKSSPKGHDNQKGRDSFFGGDPFF